MCIREVLQVAQLFGETSYSFFTGNQEDRGLSVFFPERAERCCGKQRCLFVSHGSSIQTLLTGSNTRPYSPIQRNRNGGWNRRFHLIFRRRAILPSKTGIQAFHFCGIRCSFFRLLWGSRNSSGTAEFLNGGLLSSDLNICCLISEQIVMLIVFLFMFYHQKVYHQSMLSPAINVNTCYVLKHISCRFYK